MRPLKFNQLTTINTRWLKLPDKFGTTSLSIEFNETCVFLASQKEFPHWSLELNNNRVMTSENLRLESISDWKWPDVSLHLIQHCRITGFLGDLELTVNTVSSVSKYMN